MSRPPALPQALGTVDANHDAARDTMKDATVIKGYGRLLCVPLQTSCYTTSSAQNDCNDRENQCPKQGRRRQVFEPELKGAAPIVHIGRGECFWCHHRPECCFARTPEASFAALQSPSHTSRSFCSCMSQYALDKAYALELQERDMTIDAYEVVEKSLSKMYGLAAVSQDDDLMRIVDRYKHCRAFYKLLGELDAGGSASLFQRLPSLTLDVQSPPSQVSDDGGSSGFNSSIASTTNSNSSSVSLESGADNPQRSVSIRALVAQNEAADTCSTPPSVPAHRHSIQPSLSPGWKCVMDEADLRVWYKPLQHSTALVFRLDGRIPAPVLNVVSVLAEVAYTQKWVPSLRKPLRMGLVDARCVERIGRFEKLTTYDFAMPWPFKNRFACVYSWLVDDLERNQILTFGYKTLTPKDAHSREFASVTTIPATPPHSVRVDFDGGVTAGPLDHGTSCYIRMLSIVDPKERLSSAVINVFTGIFTKMAFGSFRRQCVDVSRQPTSEFFVAQKQDHWLYDFLQERLEQVVV